MPLRRQGQFHALALAVSLQAAISALAAMMIFMPPNHGSRALGIEPPFCRIVGTQVGRKGDLLILESAAEHFRLVARPGYTCLVPSSVAVYTGYPRHARGNISG